MVSDVLVSCICGAGISVLDLFSIMVFQNLIEFESRFVFKNLGWNFAGKGFSMRRICLLTLPSDLPSDSAMVIDISINLKSKGL